MPTSTSGEKNRDTEMAASKESAMAAYEKLLEAREHFTKAAQAAGMDLKHDAIEQLEKGRVKADELSNEAGRYVREKPLASLGIAALAGYLLAQIFGRR